MGDRNTGTTVNDDKPQWFAAVTRNGQWKKIGQRLSELGVAFFIPETFSTLLFIHTTKAEALTLVNSGTVNARFIIDHNTRTLLRVPDKQMEDFIRVLNLSPSAECMSDAPLVRGSRVRVVKGALSGVEGKIVELPEGLYLVVSVASVLSARIEIPKSHVVAI